MEPIPETVDALRRLQGNGRGDPAVLEELRRLTTAVRRVVPSCIGLSIGSTSPGITLTFVDRESPVSGLAPLDFIAGGRDIASDRRTEGANGDPTNEASWHSEALAEALAGIASSLSIPLMEDEQVVGTVTFYSSRESAFADVEERLAALCGAWAPGAVSNVDLSFSSRLRAAAAPGMLDDLEQVDRAAGIASAALHLPVAHARSRLRAASRRAGISEVELARQVIAARAGGS